MKLSHAIAVALVTVSAAVCATACAVDGSSDDLSTEAQAGRAASCELVRCFAPPVCDPGQRVVYTPNDCCGTCVGPEDRGDRCADVLCPAVECEPGFQRVYSPGQCCGVCVPNPPEACGDTVCGGDEFCCNDSCGICAPLDGGACTLQFCDGATK